MRFSNRYYLSFSGISGSGKTTTQKLIAEKLSISPTSKKCVYPLRLNSYKGFLSYLDAYFQLTKKIEMSDCFHVTSRLGIIDIPIYAEAYRELNIITNEDYLDIFNECEILSKKWLLPKYLAFLYANCDVLCERLNRRDLYDKVCMERKPEEYNFILDSYFKYFTQLKCQNSFIKSIIEKYRKIGNLIIIDTTNLSIEMAVKKVLSKIR